MLLTLVPLGGLPAALCVRVEFAAQGVAPAPDTQAHVCAGLRIRVDSPSNRCRSLRRPKRRRPKLDPPPSPRHMLWNQDAHVQRDAYQSSGVFAAQPDAAQELDVQSADRDLVRRVAPQRSRQQATPHTPQ